MKSARPLSNQRGVALLAALFLLVVLAALGLFMVTMSGVQSRIPVFALQGARAYQAARSGIEWGIYRVETDHNCNTITGATQPFAIDNLNVTVSCTGEPSSGTYQEGSVTYHVFRIVAFADRGNYGSPDYVSRKVIVKVTGE